MKRLLHVFLVGLAFVCAGAAPALAQESAEEFTNRLLAKMQAYQANPATAQPGFLTGLWQVERGQPFGENAGVIQISHVSDVLIQSILDTTKGMLKPVGFAEETGGQWRGWFELTCPGCCPGRSWLDQGSLTVDERQKTLHFRADTRRMDPGTCVLTDEPRVADGDMKLVHVLSFKEYLPGKLVHIVAAPAVGSQRAQYKASVTPQWDISGFGVASVSLGVRSAHGGQWLLQKSPQIAGDYEFLTDRSGAYFFVFTAWNARGQPLHFEIESIEVPPIPGIGG